MVIQRRLASGFTRVLNWNFSSLRSKTDALKIEYEIEGKKSELTVPFVWLRDHCTSSKCFHAPTNQRKANCTDLFSRSKVERKDQVKLSENNSIFIDWIDGHRSEFHIDELLGKAISKNQCVKSVRKLWNHAELEKVPEISSKSLDLKKFSENLVKYGVVVINDVKPTAEGTEQLCKSLVPVHDTFFGQFWVFSNSATEDEPAYEDTAYGNDGIGPHTDGTYFNQTPGIQVFHCLQPAKSGGDTVLVDSFHCAEKLKNEHPADFETLVNTKISHHYLEGSPPGSSICSVSLEKPVIEIDSSGNITQVRFNPYDRAPFNCLSSNKSDSLKAIQFYEAYDKFSRLCHSAENAVKISLQPGSVIFIDNFRVLHSRTAFQGYRKMCGCYLSRDNFYAKARPFLSKNIAQFV
uniref:Trimethyllysine dioxygenase, mitochondrial n=1 Tax=Caenorhabditis japonica TaxID=281687 RepID=A0A8R1HXJ8_CAEJA